MGKVCTAAEQAKCLVENDGELDWACTNCPKTRYENLHDYTKKLLSLANLQKAGYPLQINDLTLDEWHDLGTIKQIIEPTNQHNQPTIK